MFAFEDPFEVCNDRIEKVISLDHAKYIGYRCTAKTNPKFVYCLAMSCEIGVGSLDEDVERASKILLDLADVGKHGLYVALAALNALDHVDDRVAFQSARVSSLPRQSAAVPSRMGNYVGRLLDKIVSDLQPTEPE